MNHIRDKLPDMKARLNTLMGQTQQELNAFGDSTFLGEQHRGSLILQLMTQFVRDFVASIDGTSLEISTKELCGGARIYFIFNDVFGHALESINPTHNLTVQDIRTAIRNSTGPRPSLFVPEVAFDLLVKPQIKLLEPPSLRCVELVYEELMKICHNCTSTVSHGLSHALSLPPLTPAHRNCNVTRACTPNSSRSCPSFCASDWAPRPSTCSRSSPFRRPTSTRTIPISSRVQRQPRRLPRGRRTRGDRRRWRVLRRCVRECVCRWGQRISADSWTRDVQPASDDGGDRSASGPEDDDETNGGYIVANGRNSSRHADPKTRSTSSTIHDRNRNGPDFGGIPSGNASTSSQSQHLQHPSTSSSSHSRGLSSSSPSTNNHLLSPHNHAGGIPPFASPYGSSPSSSSAKESFLNYFFGGSEGMHPGAGGVGSNGQRALPDMRGAGEGRAGGREDNPLTGRRGLEGNAAAFDMKSLDKHLEAVRVLSFFLL